MVRLALVGLVAAIGCGGANPSAPKAPPEGVKALSNAACSVNLTKPAYQHDAIVGVDVCGTVPMFPRWVYMHSPSPRAVHTVSVRIEPNVTVGQVLTFPTLDAFVAYSEGTVETRCDNWNGTVTFVGDRPAFHVQLNLTCSPNQPFAGGEQVVGDFSSTL